MLEHIFQRSRSGSVAFPFICTRNHLVLTGSDSVCLINTSFCNDPSNFWCRRFFCPRILLHMTWLYSLMVLVGPIILLASFLTPGLHTPSYVVPLRHLISSCHVFLRPGQILITFSPIPPTSYLPGWRQIDTDMRICGGYTVSQKSQTCGLLINFQSGKIWLDPATLRIASQIHPPICGCIECMEAFPMIPPFL